MCRVFRCVSSTLTTNSNLPNSLAGDSRPLKIYGSEETVTYNPMKRTGVAISKLGASKAISIGAYVYALEMIDSEE